MMLTHVVDAYLAKQRSLGKRFESAEALLRRFCRAMGDRDIEEVTSEAASSSKAEDRLVPPGCCDTGS
jgi:integrase/recombinase XerD